MYGQINVPSLFFPGDPDSAVPSDANSAMQTLYQNELISVGINDYKERTGACILFCRGYRCNGESSPT